ncbi:hypothetical protein RSAG8_13933, partial [Rhizoctonia solani AG-8 WAC10335]
MSICRYKHTLIVAQGESTFDVRTIH